MTTETNSTEVLAFDGWRDNASLIADVARLGYIEGSVLDLTYGKGLFWSKFRPDNLSTNDRDESTDAQWHFDFCNVPYGSGQFDTVVFDPPYKLNGTPSLGEMDDRYGVMEKVTRRDRMARICGGTVEAARLSSKWLLVKCMDQTNGGRVRWQTNVVESIAWAMEFEQVDSFPLSGGMPQPAGRKQEHARRYFSTLIVFKRCPR